ncbi:MAG: hypothetical protein DIZ80_16180 [endosymbiont of Galathealinum brachiosum]|uniref:Uncharacterized protein n=1 Tax=endosymbiont of Galathealinum brachiosum TaxID=2200906 RepID=A0A370D9N7_9GAMM|nr:MAG: hypothetical protein DIZ80_16180 [endosymbiont of Galathealinum brachiosum]
MNTDSLLSASSMILNSGLILAALFTIYYLRRPNFQKSESWQATLTPLSSIIGSGFLIMSPLLASVVGILSPVAVTGIVILAYAIGSVIRFNIMHVEPRIKDGSLSQRTREVEYLGDIALVLAYMVAVAFYLSLLSSFLLSYLGVDNIDAERWLTTVIILFISFVGYQRGLGGLEKLEAVSMTVQLSIVVSLLLGLGAFSYVFYTSGGSLSFDYPQRDVSTQVRILAGALLVVQGFETSRFLGEKYSPEVRVATMKKAQIISGILYVVSVILFLPVVQYLDLQHVQLAKIVDVTGQAALVLPFMLIGAALMSQFSAAVADTGGGGGLLSENSGKKLSTRISYLGISICAVLLVWAVDLIEIITLASRAFAFYYFLQALLALNFCYRDCSPDSRMTVWRRMLFMSVALILLYIIFFAIPAE